MKKYLSLLLVAIVPTMLLAQKTPSTSNPTKLHISKNQMYEDFDEFINIFKTYNAQWDIRAELTGYNVIQELENRKECISNIKNYWQFIDFMSDNLNFLIDDHATMRLVYYNILHPRYAPGQSFYDSTGIKEIATGLDKYLVKRGKRKGPKDYFYGVSSKYINGQYYMAMYWRLINPLLKDTISLKNARIIACDHEPIDTYVRKSIGKSYPENTRWDFHNNKYFTTNLWIQLDKTLKVENEDGRIYEFIPDDYSIKLFQKSDDELRNNQSIYKNKELIYKKDHIVRYYPEQQVLYIYLHQMSSPENYNLLDSLRKEAFNKTIEKIVVDVRDNIGGGDGYWYDLLSFLISDTISFEHRVALNCNEHVSAFLFAEFPPEMTQQFSIQEIPFLHNKKMFVREDVMTIEPDSLSLMYSGPIYILQDEKTYSAAHSFASLAKQIPQLISVGVSTGDMVGFGLNPWGFQLKHSKFTFQFEPAIDLSGANRLEDTYQCIPEIEVIPTIKEISDYYDWRWKIPIEDFLFTKDYLFMKIIQL